MLLEHHNYQQKEYRTVWSSKAPKKASIFRKKIVGLEKKTVQ